MLESLFTHGTELQREKKANFVSEGIAECIFPLTRWYL